MKISIRNKLILAISLLVVVLFGTASSLFIREKKTELAHDIYVESLAFARLTAGSIANYYDLYLKQNSFVYFNREMAAVFRQNEDISAIQVFSYDGQLLYDSEVDRDGKYLGSQRLTDDEKLLDQVHSENLSLKTADGKVFYLKFDPEKGYSFVDKNEKMLEPMEEGSILDYLIMPANEKYAVLYKLDYENLNARLAHMRERIIYLALFGVMLGMIMSALMSHQVTRPIAELVEGAGKIAKGDFTARVNIRTRDEMSFLGKAFNQMAQDLEKSIENRIYKERVTGELQMAAKIQDQLIPDTNEIPVIEGLQIAADLIPAEEIGGDIYDFIKVGEKRMVMYLGDVTGHGVPAGIISSISSALFYGFSLENDLKKILLEVNRVLKAKTMPTMFLTLCLMQWDGEAEKFTYASAGHEQILHYRAAAKVAEYKAAGGIALGMLPDISKHINVVDIDFQVGDYLVIYSDGIPECWKNEKELYGPERLKAAMEKFAALGDADAVKKAILADVHEFAAGHKQMDDITIMVVKRT